MFKTRIIGLYQLLQLMQISLITFFYAVLLLAFVKFYHPDDFFDVERYAITWALMVLALLLTAGSKELEHMNILNPNFLSAHEISIRRTLAVFLAQLFFIFITKNDSVSRAFLLGFQPILYALLFFTHRYIPPFLAQISFSGERVHRILLCGTIPELQRVKYWLDRKRRLGLKPIGLLTNDENPPKLVNDIPVLGTFEDLEEAIKEHSIAQVMFLHIPEPKKKAAHYYRHAERHGARMLILNDLEEIIGHSVDSMQDDGLTFFGIRREPLENIVNRLQKRLLDIAMSTLVILFILPPVAIIVKLAQLFQSPGPLIHRQIRAGLHNRSFELIKFRTMHEHSEPLARQASQNDRRIYPFGALFRRFSIDELPQFWNVLRGEMSVVGPRPHLPEHNADFAQIMGHYQVRSFVKPGITGLAQVRGFRGEAKNKGELIARIVSDLYYIENWSLSMDILIIIRTAFQMFFPPRSAY